MADVMPNYELEAKRLEVDIDQLRVNIQKAELSILELEDTKQKHRDNIEALKQAIIEKSEALAGLRESLESGGDDGDE
jgi:predicted  nucleic acid-binding Zn-ribbon protein